jgi:CubicO group peptidase (beta-lactamase class C family)
MKKLIYLITLLLAAGQYAGAQQRKLEQVLQEHEVSGVQLVYARNGMEKAYVAGVIRDGSSQAVNGETVFHAASLSKSVFAYVFFRLYDRGLIGLDVPLEKYTGNYSKFNDPRISLITASMVLRHTTGMPNWGDDNGYKMVFSPDSCFSYSGEGYTFLQTAIEKITGKPLNQLAIEEVFGPLQMRNSSYIWEDRFAGRVGFDRSDQKDHRYVNQEPNAAYSLLTTAHDYTLFLQALMAGKGLKPATANLIFEKATSAQYNMTKNDADPYIAWGLGVGLQHNEKGMAAWHWGDGYGGDYKCFYLVFPATKESLVFFTHSNKGLDMTTDIVNLFLGKQTTWAIKWLGYGYQYPEAMKKFKNQLLKKSYKQAIQLAEQEKRMDTTFQLSENDLNSYGYELLGLGKQEQALEIFKLNVHLFPKSSNTYDSLAETYQAMGEKEPAISNYKKVLELNPKSTNAVKHLTQLESHP